jgi:hypothetical protein
MKKKKQKTIDLKKYLAIISILAFFGIFVNSATGWQVDNWIDGLLYMIMGVALMIAGGIRMFFDYFKNGLTTTEISKILTDIVGLISFFSGLSIILQWSSPIIVGLRAIIAIIAIVIITSDLIGGKKK